MLTQKTLVNILVVLFGIVLFTIIPMTTIWALNQIFHLNISFTLPNVIAMLWMNLIFLTRFGTGASPSPAKRHPRAAK